MASKTIRFLLFVAITSWLSAAAEPSESSNNNNNNKGRWKLLKRSIGVSAMHMQLLPNDKIIAFDRTNFGPSNISLPQGKCISESLSSSPLDCFAHSVEFDPFTRTIRPLTVLTDTWCSSGALTPDGVLLQSGGYKLGERVVRSFKPCPGCDWSEVPDGLISPRWYASNQVLPDGRIIVVGGRYNFNYEFIPKTSDSDRVLHQLPFLKETRYTPLIPNNLYPFLHLSPDGNLFVFANDRAILLDYITNKVIRRLPVIPGGFSRNYPSTGSSVLLPIRLDQNETSPEAEVLVCGGTTSDSNGKADFGIFLPATNTCGRLVITSENSSWEIEEMPLNRVMGDMIMLPTGDVLIINGAGKGTAGWNVAREPVLNPVIYYPDVDRSGGRSRFEVMSPSPIPRLYHSSAHLLSDGRVIVGGSNPNSNYNFTTLYPTELSLEAFFPPYMVRKSRLRPSIKRIKPGPDIAYGQMFSIEIQASKVEERGKMYVTMVAPSFTTHSFAMNQRLLVLKVEAEDGGVGGRGSYVVKVNAPAKAAFAPPGYYQLFVVREGVPSKGMWVRIR
ncbi:Aldehyde oxidase GLOX1 [Linum perenne]